MINYILDCVAYMKSFFHTNNCPVVYHLENKYYVDGESYKAYNLSREQFLNNINNIKNRTGGPKGDSDLSKYFEAYSETYPNNCETTNPTNQLQVQQRKNIIRQYAGYYGDFHGSIPPLSYFITNYGFPEADRIYIDIGFYDYVIM